MKSIQELLTEKGFVEGQDYTYDGVTLVPVQKTRQVEQTIHHEEVPAQYEEQEVLDENGQSYDPPQYEQVEVAPAQPAYDETVLVDETYSEAIPSLEELCREILQSESIALIVGEYLKDKPVGENDSLNIDLFMKGGDGFRFENVERPTFKQLYDMADSVKAGVEQDSINKEALKYLADTDWLIIREMDEGTPCPAEIKAERAAARARIVR